MLLRGYVVGHRFRWPLSSGWPQTHTKGYIRPRLHKSVFYINGYRLALPLPAPTKCVFPSIQNNRDSHTHRRTISWVVYRHMNGYILVVCSSYTSCYLCQLNEKIWLNKKPIIICRLFYLRSLNVFPSRYIVAYTSTNHNFESIRTIFLSINISI